MNTTTTYTVQNEDDLIELLSKLDTVIESRAEIRFDGWPKLDITIKGDRYHHTLPTATMQPLIEFQRVLYRTYANIKYQKDARSLNTDERRQLELLFEIKEGSTGIEALISDFFNAALPLLREALSDPQTARDLILTLGAVSLTAIGKRIHENHLQHKLDLTREEKENQRLKIFADIIQKSTHAQYVAKEISAIEDSIAASVPDAEEVRIGALTYDRAAIQALNQTKRRRLEVQPLQDIFIVKTIDHHTRFQQDTVVLVSPETDIKITAKLITDDTHWLSREDIDRLHEAFKRRIPLEVSLLVRRDPDTGEITNAEIIAIGDMLDTATA